MAAVSPRASGLWEHSAMTYSRLSTHDAIGDLDDPEGNEYDSRTPLDRTIDQIGMGTPFSPLFSCTWAVDVAATSTS